MSKAQRIRELYAQGLGTGEIARIVGCKPEYVRVAGRQRRDGMSAADKRWHKTETYKTAQRDYHRIRYQTDVEFRARHLAICKAYRERRSAAAQNRL